MVIFVRRITIITITLLINTKIPITEMPIVVSIPHSRSVIIYRSWCEKILKSSLCFCFPFEKPLVEAVVCIGHHLRVVTVGIDSIVVERFLRNRIIRVHVWLFSII